MKFYTYMRQLALLVVLVPSFPLIAMDLQDVASSDSVSSNAAHSSDAAQCAHSLSDPACTSAALLGCSAEQFMDYVRQNLLHDHNRLAPCPLQSSALLCAQSAQHAAQSPEASTDAQNAAASASFSYFSTPDEFDRLLYYGEINRFIQKLSMYTPEQKRLICTKARGDLQRCCLHSIAANPKITENYLDALLPFAIYGINCSDFQNHTPLLTAIWVKNDLFIEKVLAFIKMNPTIITPNLNAVGKGRNHRKTTPFIEAQKRAKTEADDIANRSPRFGMSRRNTLPLLQAERTVEYPYAKILRLLEQERVRQREFEPELQRLAVQDMESIDNSWYVTAYNSPLSSASSSALSCNSAKLSSGRSSEASTTLSSATSSPETASTRTTSSSAPSSSAMESVRAAASAATPFVLARAGGLDEKRAVNYFQNNCDSVWGYETDVEEVETNDATDDETTY